MVFRKSGSLSVILAISLLFSSCAANAGIFSFCRRRPLFTVGVFSVAAILVFVFLKAARDVAGEIGWGVGKAFDSDINNPDLDPEEKINKLKEAFEKVNKEECTEIALKFYDGKKVLRQIQENEIDITVNDDKGNTILHVAAENGDSETIKLLIGKGADVSATNEDGYTPLVNAAKKGDLESVKTLIEDGGADATDNAVLHFAAWKGGDLETVKYIVGCNAEIYEGDIILSKTEEIKQYLREAQVRRQRIKNMQKDGASRTHLLQN